MAAQEKSTPAQPTPLRTKRQQSLTASSLKQAPEYARPLRPHWVAALARTWRDQWAGEIMISHRADGSYRLMTGNHRWAAKLLQGDRLFRFDCLVYTGLTVKEEAEIYLSQDKYRLHHTAADDFQAMLTQEDPVAVEVKGVLDGLGLEVSPFGGAGYSKTRIRAVSALLRAHETAGVDALKLALTVIRDEWLEGLERQALGHVRKTAFSEVTILPLSVFIRLYRDDPRFDEKRLRGALRRTGLVGYEQAYSTQRAASAARASTGVATLYGVLALLDIVNYGRQPQNRLEEAVAREATTLTRFRPAGVPGKPKQGEATTEAQAPKNATPGRPPRSMHSSQDANALIERLRKGEKP